MKMKLPFPQSVLSQHIIVLGKTRSGKSSKMRLIVEELLEREEPVCVIDPKGDWWGLKSSADGNSPGFPIVIFGGEHADVPLNRLAGVPVAELVATGNRPCLIDLGGWMPGDRTRFFVDFASTFFRLTRGRRFLVIDEVHNFAPQGRVLDPDAGKMLHWANRLASEGSGKGVTLLAASQRPQKVHKDFVTSCETLIACKVIHRLDRDAIKDWIDGCADPSLGRQVIGELASLKKPEAWVWSPEVEFGPKRVEFPMFQTYDSFKPREEQAPAKLTGWAAVDLEDVRGKLASAIAEAEANDPAALKRRIAELERQIASKAAPKEETSRADVDTAYKSGYDQGHEHGFGAGEQSAYRQFVSLREAALRAIKAERQAVIGLIEGAGMPPLPEWQGTALRPTVTVHPSPRALKAPTREALGEAARVMTRVVQRQGNGAGEKLPKVQRKFLTVLAQRQGKSTTRNQVAIFAGYSSASGHVDSTLSALRTGGYAEGPGDAIRITERGVAALGFYDPLPTGPELRRYWLEHAGGKAPRAMLQVILEAYPRTLTRDEVAEASGYSKDSGHVDSTLSYLRSIGLIVGPGTAIRASEELFN